MQKLFATIAIVLIGFILLILNTVWKAIILIPLTIEAVFFSKKKRGKRK